MTDTSSTSNLESVLRRVHKLLAIANDERANPAEAAAAASQAENIMRKFQIEHADVIAAQLQRDDAFNTEDVGGTMNPDAHASSTTTWAGRLGLVIAELNDCKAAWVRTERLGVCLRFSGFKSDTQVALWTYLYITNQMGQALRGFQQLRPNRAMSHQFRLGFVTAVSASIKRAIGEKRAEMALAPDSRALVLAKAHAVAERFGAQQVRHTNTRPSNGFRDGHTEGCKVDVARRSVTGSSASTPRLGG